MGGNEHGAHIDIGGRQLFFQTFGGGEPTVIFESGGDDGSESLVDLARRVQPFARALVYDRAGLGQSDPASRPRTVQDAVHDLDALLRAAHISGPYLLVGHSFGGLIARLYAIQHPQAVIGLVLLDVPHPEQSMREARLLPPPTEGEPPALTASRNFLMAEWSDPFSTSEAYDHPASAAQLLAAGGLGHLPLVVVTAGIDEPEEGIPAEVASALAEDWMRTQRELAGLSSNGTHVIAARSTHAIQDCEPELVIDLIRRLAATRGATL